MQQKKKKKKKKNKNKTPKNYDKRDDWFWYSQFPFSGWRCPPAYLIWGIHISTLGSPELLQILMTLTVVIKALTAKLLRQGYSYFKLRKAFSKLYRRHSTLLEKYSVSLKIFLQQGISEPEFYSDLVYRFRKKLWENLTFGPIQKLTSRYKRIWL